MEGKLNYLSFTLNRRIWKAWKDGITVSSDFVENSCFLRNQI